MTLNFGSTLFPSRSEFSKSYDWNNFITGNSYLELNLSNSFNTREKNDDGDYEDTTNKFITSSSLRSHNIVEMELAGTGSTTSFKKKFTHDYDMLANTQLIINGKVILGVTVKTSHVSDLFRPRWDFSLIKYDGTTETVLGTKSFDYMEQEGSFEKRLSISFDISDKKVKKGEYLRVKIEGYTKQSSNSSSKFGYYIDPSNSTKVGTNSDLSTNFILAIPFKLDI